MGRGVDEGASRRRRALSLIGVFVALIGAVVVWQRVADDDQGADTDLIEAPGDLRFDTPEQALDNFLAAFASGEFELAVDMLSNETRAVFSRFDANGVTTLPSDERLPAFDLGAVGDAFFLPAHVGGELLELAALSGTLPVDLRDGVSERQAAIDGDTATITGSLGNGLETTVRLTTTADGTWRIEQIATPGGDPTTVPFSAAPGNEPPARTPDQISRYADRFDMTSGEAFAVASLRIVEADDFFSLNRVTGTSALLAQSRAINEFDVRLIAGPPARALLENIDDPVEYFQRWGGGMPALWAEADALGGMYVDPVGPYEVVGTDAHPTVDQFTVVSVVDGDGVAYDVTVIDVGTKGWRLEQILASGGDPDIVPLSGPSGVEVLPGTEVCWDHIRFDCGSNFAPQDVPEIAAFTEALESSADAATASADLRNLEIELIPDLDQMCATMQGQRTDLTFPQSWIDLAPIIIEKHCPGEASRLVPGDGS